MAKVSFLLVLLVFIFIVTGSAEPMSSRRSRYRVFIENSCRPTRYPALCVQCLSSYSNASNSTLMSPQELAQVSLAISLVRARYTRAYVMQVSQQVKEVKGKDRQSLLDCLNQINDSVDRLSQSIRELKRMTPSVGDDDFRWHMSNVETWVSAALTDATTCVDAFSGRTILGKTKATIKAKVLNVAQVTSNSLALFHRYAMRHRYRGSAGLIKNP